MKFLENSNRNIVETGNILISEPYLMDLNFNRSVVLICDDSKGHLGFILNKTIEIKLDEVISINTINKFPVFAGGPVSQNSLHFLHRRPDLISGGKEITEGIYWGGNFETVSRLLNDNQIEKSDIRFFIGYSGWTPGQIVRELQEKSWIIGNISHEMLFDHQPENLWKDVLSSMGSYYKLLTNCPDNPQYN